MVQHLMVGMKYPVNTLILLCMQHPSLCGIENAFFGMPAEFPQEKSEKLFSAWCLMNIYRKLLCFALALLLFVISDDCFANTGNRVYIADRGAGSLYYRICTLHPGLPIYYYVSDSINAIPITINGRVYNANGAGAIESALAHWSSATAVPGQPHRCTFRRSDAQEHADLVFEVRYTGLPPAVADDPNVDSYRSRGGDVLNVITLLPRRISNRLDDSRMLFIATPIETYINNYLAARLLHLTGHALGLDHPGIETSPDVLPRPEPRNRSVYEASDIAEDELWRPHIMMRYTLGYLLELQQHLGRPLELGDIRPAEAENRAIRFYLAEEWVCTWPLVRHARVTASSISPGRCLPHPSELALPAAVSFLLN